MAKKKFISTDELERRLDAGEDLSDYIDRDKAVFRLNVDIPLWAVKELNAESDRRGITRQSLIKTWLVDKLDEMRKAPLKVAKG